MYLKSKLLAGQKIYGTMLRVVRNPAVCVIAKNSGLDFVMYDCEHSNYTMETLHDLFLTGTGYGLESFLRVPALSKDYISRALDQGASGVMVPMLETGESARLEAIYSKYQPIGGRGYCGAIAHCNYQGGKHSSIMEEANGKVITIAQVETVQTLDNIDDIAATEGIDALLVGPNDLSISLGIPGDLMNSIEIEAIRTVIAACKRNNKAFGLHAGAAMLKLFMDDLNIVMMQSDVDFLSNGFAGIKTSLL